MLCLVGEIVRKAQAAHTYTHIHKKINKYENN